MITSTDSTFWDSIIIGGAPAGLSVALAMANMTLIAEEFDLATAGNRA